MLKYIGIFLLGFLLGAIIVAIAIPLNLNSSRIIAADNALNSIDKLKNKIGEAIINTETVESINLSAFETKVNNIDYIYLLPSNTILIKAYPYGQLLILKPHITQGKINSWECIGGSIKEVPVSCRNRIDR